MDRRGEASAGDVTQNRVLLVFSDDRDRRLLREWLADFPGYEVVVADSPDEVPAGFDIALCDEQAVRRFVPVLEARQHAADPVFLPCVLLLTDSADHASEAVRQAVEAETDLDIQEYAALPVDQASFHRRLENLLRAREASLRLAERTQQYRELVRLAPEAILLVRDGEIVYANESAATLFGHRTADAAVEMPLSAYLPDDDRAVAEVVDAVREGDNADSHAEGQVRTRDGEVRTVEIAGVEIHFEGEPTTQLVLRDVTERREREEQLTLFERAIETAAQGITIADARQEDMPLVYVNEAFEDITGYSVAESLGENCRFLQGDGTDPETVAKIRRALDEESPVSVEILNYRKDGTPFWNQLDIVPVRNDSGSVTHYLGLQQDVTGRIEREQRLSVLDRVLRHNVRNRGNVIKARAEQIRRGEVDSPADVAGDIADAVDELVTITDQVRTFRSVITQDRDELVEHDLVALLDGAWEGLKADSGATDAEVTFDVPASAPVRAHPMLPFGIGELLRRLRGDTSSLAVGIGRDADAVSVGFTVDESALTRMEMDVVDQVRETPVEHAQGLEMWLVRWIVAGSGGDLFLEDAGDDRLTLRMRLRAAR
jgi:PAS domain S-box-containing protein